MKKFFIYLSLLMNTNSLSAQSYSTDNGLALPSVNNQFSVSNSNSNINSYTGTIAPIIPLYELGSKQLKIPISLSYIAGRGIKVQDVAGYTGLGWKFNCGGAISRLMRGLPDEQTNGYIGTAHFGATLNAVNPSSITADILSKVGTGKYDGEPDIFSVNTPFFSFQFVFDENGNPVFPNNNGFKIIHNLYNNASPESTSFVVTDCSGNQYYFGSTVSSCEKSTITSTLTTTPLQFTSTWYLDKIISFNGNDQVTFNYISSSDYSVLNYSVNSTQLSSTSNCSVSSTPIVSNNTQTNTYNSPKYLSSIISSIGEVDFTYLYDRRDVTNAAKLSTITVFPKNSLTLTKGNPIKMYQFNYSYFGDPSTIQDQLRLRLDNIQVTGNSAAPFNNTYQFKSFDYNQINNLPSRKSVEFDYWGYYNINNTGTSLVPTANKNVDFNRTQANILTAIHEITGETTQFVFELNDYSSTNVNQIFTGGLRIKNIIKKNSSGDNISTSYFYSDEKGKSTGQINNNLFANFQNTVFATIFGGGSACVVTGTNTKSESIYNSYDLNGNAVGYSSIKIIAPNGGYEINKFTNFSDFPDNYANSVAKNSLYGYPNCPQLSAVTSYAYKRGLLLNKKYFSAVGNPISESQNTYSSLNSVISKSLSIKTTPLNYLLGTTVTTYIYGTYYSNIENYALSKTVQIDYDQQIFSNFLQKVITYTYCPNNRSIKSISTTDSKGNTKISTTYHTDDINIPMLSNSEQAAISSMLLSNNTDAIIHKINNINGSLFQQHSIFNTGLGGSSKVFLITSANYKGTNLLNAVNFNYDVIKTTLVSSFAPLGQPSSFLTGYGDTYQIAKITNANSFYVGGTVLTNEFYFEGFEQNNYTGPGLQLSYGHTGNACYDATLVPFIVNFVIPNSRLYVIHWWSYLNGTWSLNEKPYIGSITISGIIDDIRINPSDSKMTSYTFDPLIGITSVSDENNKANFYTYDAFGNLILIRDQDKNIVKKFYYNIAGQPENSIVPLFYNDLQQATFTSQASCVLPGTTAPTTTYSIAANTYSSYIDKSTANQLALTAMNLGGQSAANLLPCNSWNIYLTNNASYGNFLFPLYIDNIMYNFPVSGVSNRRIVSLPSGNHVFKFLCGPTSNFAMSPFNSALPVPCGNNFTLSVNSDITFSFYPVYAITCSVSNNLNPLLTNGFCSSGNGSSKTIYSTCSTMGPGCQLYYDVNKTQPINDILWVRPWTGTGKIIYSVDKSGTIKSLTYGQNCP